MSSFAYILFFGIATLVLWYFNRWEKFDPEWLAELAQDQYPDDIALHKAIRKCTRMKNNHFVVSKKPNQLGSEWQFEKSVTLIHPEMDDIILDILKDGRVGSIEYLGMMCKNET